MPGEPPAGRAGGSGARGPGLRPFRIHPGSAFPFISRYVDFEVPLETVPLARRDFAGKPMSVTALVEKACRLIDETGGGRAGPGIGESA